MAKQAPIKWLKACPFCGGQTSHEAGLNKNENGYFIECVGCGACGPFIKHFSVSKISDSIAEAIRWWEIRITPLKKDKKEKKP